METSRKGFSSVFLTMIFGAMIMLTFGFVYASADRASSSSCDAVFSLAGQSVLTEFDLEIKEKYGLIAFGLNQMEIEKRLFYYANSTFKAKRELNMIPIELSQVEVNLKDYSMVNVENFEKAIFESMKYEIVNKIIKKKERHEPAGDYSERVLRNKAILESLPSKGVEGSSLFNQLVLNADTSLIEDGFKKGVNVFFVNTYIFQRFKNNQNSNTVKEETFFDNEVEYILYGEFSDNENREKFMTDFIKMKIASNLVHIYTDQIKIREISALAAILTPGPAAIGTQAVIAAAWATAEALNDGKLLAGGKNVAFIKSRNNWALDIGAYKGKGGGAVEPLDSNGYNYQDYLGLFIALEDREVKLLRIMDLIQINMIGNYDENFLISDYFSGFGYQVTANGKKFNYEEAY